MLGGTSPSPSPAPAVGTFARPCAAQFPRPWRKHGDRGSPSGSESSHYVGARNRGLRLGTDPGDRILVLVIVSHCGAASPSSAEAATTGTSNAPHGWPDRQLLSGLAIALLRRGPGRGAGDLVHPDCLHGGSSTTFARGRDRTGQRVRQLPRRDAFTGRGSRGGCADEPLRRLPVVPQTHHRRSLSPRPTDRCSRPSRIRARPRTRNAAVAVEPCPASGHSTEQAPRRCLASPTGRVGSESCVVAPTLATRTVPPDTPRAGAPHCHVQDSGGVQLPVRVAAACRTLRGCPSFRARPAAVPHTPVSDVDPPARHSWSAITSLRPNNGSTSTAPSPR